MDRVMDLATRFALQHQRSLAIIGALWFALGYAASAGFVDLPRIPFVTDSLGWLVAGIWNALWWGAINPALERRRAALAAPEADVQEG